MISFRKKLSLLISMSMLITTLTPASMVYATEDVGKDAFFVKDYTPTATNWDMYDEDYLDLFTSWNRDRGPAIYQIHYDYQGGVLDEGETNPDTYMEDMADDIILNNPHKAGYSFDGWIGTDDANADITQALQVMTISADSVGDRYFRAMFSPISYRISYDYDGGSVLENNPSRYNIEDPSFNLNDAYKEGFIFKGYIIKKGIEDTFSAVPVKYSGDNKIMPGAGDGEVLDDLMVKAVYEERAVPFIKELPHSTPITLGSVLGLSVLTGGKVTVSEDDDTELTGTWRWIEALTIPTLDDSELTLYDVIFLPDDTDNFSPVTGRITVKVNPIEDGRIMPFIKEKPEGSDAYAKDPLGSSILTGGKVTVSEMDDTVVTGLWVWTDPGCILSLDDSENTDFMTWFIPNDTFRYKVVGTDVRIKVKERPEKERIIPYIKEKPYVSTEYTVSDNIGKKIIEGGIVTVSNNSTKTVSGNWIWEKPYETVTISDNNITEYKVLYVPYDTETYDIVSTTITVRVKEISKKIVPVLSDGLPVGSAIYDEELLERSYLTGGRMQVSAEDDTEVEGFWYWRYPKTQVHLADNNTKLFDVMFIPIDLDVYEVVNAAITIPVLPLEGYEQKDVMILDKPAATPITEGSYLAASILTGGRVVDKADPEKEVSGIFIWKHGDIKPLLEDSLLTPYDVVFIPESYEYKKAECDVTVEVLPLVPDIIEKDNSVIIRRPDASAIYYGQMLKNSMLTGCGVTDKDGNTIDGSWSWDDPYIMPQLADSNKTLYDVSFTTDEDPTRVFRTKTFLEVKAFEKYHIGDVYLNKYKTSNEYTGYPICPKITCMHSQQEYNAFGLREGRMKTVTLKENVDYTVEYEDNINAGTGWIIIKGIGDYEGILKKPFTITQRPAKGLKIDEMPNFIYTGEDLAGQISANVIVRDKDRIVDPKDYIVQITGDTIGSPDQATYLSVAVKANTFGNYKNGISKSMRFAILDKGALSIENCKVALKKVPKKPFIYKAKAYKPAVMVTDAGGKKLSKKCYSVSYHNNINAGRAYIVVKGKGSYYGTVAACTFDILPADMGSCKVKGIKTLFFEGALSDLIPRLTFKKLNLIKDRDFIFKADKIEKAGFGPVKFLKMTGSVSSCSANFTGTKSIKLIVNKRNIGDKLKTRVIPNMTISGDLVSGNAIDYDISLKDRGLMHKMIPSEGRAVVYYNGELLREGVDYDISYKKSSNGSMSFTVKGKGCYKGKRSIKIKRAW